MNVSHRITELRETVGWSKNRLAKESGLSQAYISQLEAGQKEPTTSTLFKLCSALNISLVDFFTVNGSTMPPDLRRLLHQAESLTPPQRERLAEFIKSLKRS